MNIESVKRINEINEAAIMWRYSVIEHFMDDSFFDFIEEYYYVLEETEELDQFLDLYLHRKNSPYYFDKPEEKN